MIIITVVAVLVILSVYGMSQLESFYRTMTLASMPMQIIVAFASAAAFVFMYMTFLRGGFRHGKP